MMSKKGSLVIFFIWVYLYSFPGCRTEHLALNSIDSQKVDSLIKVQKVNDRTIIVNFGYDAVTALKTEQGIVLIDAGISTELTAKYRKTVENEFRQNNFVYVINTHGHPDHVGGNSIFSQAKVVGHENCRNDLSELMNNQEKSLPALLKSVEAYEAQLGKSVPNSDDWDDIFAQKIRYMSAYFDAKNKIAVKLPDITFSDSMKLDLGDTVVEMICFGKFHSNSDIVIYVPEIRTVFTGDLFSKYGRPGVSDLAKTDVVQCMRAIRWIEKRGDNIEKVIDGHGQILSRDDLKDFARNKVFIH